MTSMPASDQRRATAAAWTSDPPASTVDVTVQGTADALASLVADGLTPYVHVAGRASGQYNLPVRVDLPAGCILKEIKPSTIAVRIR